MQSALVPGRGSSIPDGDGESEDGLDDGSVEVHHHQLWQAEFHQLLQEVTPLVGFLIRELMFSSHFRSWEMMVPRKQQDTTVLLVESLRVMGVGGAFHNHLHCFQSSKSLHYEKLGN